MWGIGVILHQAIMNESVLDKPFGHVPGYPVVCKNLDRVIENRMGAFVTV